MEGEKKNGEKTREGGGKPLIHFLLHTSSSLFTFRCAFKLAYTHKSDRGLSTTTPTTSTYATCPLDSQ